VCEDPFVDDDVEPQGQKTSSHVPLLIRVSFSSMAAHLFGLASTVRTVVGIEDDIIEVVVAARMSGSQGIRKPAWAHVTIL
jgi:hypothetical protein